MIACGRVEIASCLFETLGIDIEFARGCFLVTGA
jgi:hypothetical protein